jgi:hypothetical protein
MRLFKRTASGSQARRGLEHLKAALARIFHADHIVVRITCLAHNIRSQSVTLSPSPPCRLELESATHGERVSGGRVRGRLRLGLRARARARAPRQGGPGLYPSPLPLSPRGNWQSNRGVGRGGGTLRSGGVGAHGDCKRPHGGCSAPSDGNRRMHLVAGWQVEDFGSGCAGLRKIRASGGNHRQGSKRAR